MSESTRDRMNERIRAEYNPPPETPRDAMWEEISSRVRDEGSTREPTPGLPWRRWLPSLAAAAVGLLVLGYGLGRMSSPHGAPMAGVEPGEPAAVPEATPTTRSAYRFAAARHLAESGSFLGRLRSDVAGGEVPEDAAEWARGLLTETRLILDSPGLDDGDVRQLLEDLELLLVQVVHASGTQRSDRPELRELELQQLSRGLNQNDLLPRIQRLVPPVLASD